MTWVERIQMRHTKHNMLIEDIILQDRVGYTQGLRLGNGWRDHCRGRHSHRVSVAISQGSVQGDALTR